MSKLRTIVLMFFCLFVIPSFARIMSEQQIAQLAKQYNDKGKGLFLCKSKGRTIIFTFQSMPIEGMTKESVLNEFADEEAANLAMNAINVEYLFSVNGYIVKRLRIDWIDFLNLSFKGRNLYNTKTSEKSKDVNMQIVYPKGWNVQEGNGPHVVKKFEFNFNSISILIDDSPTFISKNEAIDLLNNNIPNLIDINDLHNRFNAGFVEIYETIAMNDKVGNYPAKKFYTDGIISMNGNKFHALMISWFILYEDRQISVNGMFFVENEIDIKIKKYIMENVVSTIRFPEQYTNGDYEN